MCAGKLDGSPCDCLRYIPKATETEDDGPRTCRDCGHPESFHPVVVEDEPPKSKTVSTVSSVLERVRGEMKATADEARKEANTGFRKADESESDEQKSLGRGGHTKYKVSVRHYAMFIYAVLICMDI